MSTMTTFQTIGTKAEGVSAWSRAQSLRRKVWMVVGAVMLLTMVIPTTPAPPLSDGQKTFRANEMLIDFAESTVRDNAFEPSSISFGRVWVGSYRPAVVCGLTRGKNQLGGLTIQLFAFHDGLAEMFSPDDRARPSTWNAYCQ